MFVHVVFSLVFSAVSGSEITDIHDDDSNKHIISEIQAENHTIQKAPQYYAGELFILK